MKFFKKPIFVSTSPNAQADDVGLAFTLLFAPWRWITGNAPSQFTAEFKKYVGAEQVFLFDSGRASLYAILKVLPLAKDDEVLVQAFTCAAAVNPILWLGGKPIYIDIEADSYNMDPKDLVRKISPRTRAIIIQHTFGLPADLEEILKIAKERNLFVIEDVAHSLGAEYRGKKLGTFGDAALFSFGRYKIISSVFGGAAVVKDKALGEKMEALYRAWPYPSRFWIFKQLFHPVLLSVCKPLYNFWSIGKIPVVLARKIGLISLTVYAEEKQGGRPGFGPSVMPNALAILGRHQFKKLEKLNAHRRALADEYRKQLSGVRDIALPCESSDSVFLTFPIQIKKEGGATELIRKSLLEEGMYLENWPAKKVIGPPGVNLDKLQYEVGSCPVAESVAPRTVTLPTSPNTAIQDAMRVAQFVKDFLRQ